MKPFRSKIAPIDYNDTLDLLSASLDNTSSDSSFDRTLPLLSHLLKEDNFWTGVENIAPILQDNESATHQLIPNLSALAQHELVLEYLESDILPQSDQEQRNRSCQSQLNNYRDNYLKNLPAPNLVN